MDSDIKIIQTLYLPVNNADPIQNSLGFLSPEFNWMGWALSCRQLKQYYKQVELYTNNTGYEVLIERLKLPYDKVHVVLNRITFPAQLWAYPKLYTYSLQSAPFLHVDGDAFFWEKLDQNTLNQPLIAQNLEVNAPYYKTITSQLLNAGINLPPAIMRQWDSYNKKLAAYNAGIIGGTDLAFFKNYANEAFQFVTKNYAKLKSLNMPAVNMIYEQVLFYCIAQEKQTAVKCYLKDEIHDMGYPGFADFYGIPGNTKFIHLMGAFKRNEDCCYMLAQRLQHDYPDYYYRIIEECQKAGINLFLSIYNAEQSAAESWQNIYNDEKKHYALIQQVLKNDGLSSHKYRINRLLKIDTVGDVTTYKASLSLRMMFKELETDQLDEILIELLAEGKSFAELVELLTINFDDGDTADGREEIAQLLSLRLRKGLYDGLYEVVID